MMRILVALIAAVLLGPTGLLAQVTPAPQQTTPRDLVLDRTPTDSRVPRGYAVIVGIAQYQNPTPTRCTVF
jgi:hypothetical protein